MPLVGHFVDLMVNDRECFLREVFRHSLREDAPTYRPDGDGPKRAIRFTPRELVSGLEATESPGCWLRKWRNAGAGWVTLH
jgi:hypothetical protein